MIDEKKNEIRTYRESNYDIIIPFLKVGVVDFGVVFIVFVASFFSFHFLKLINVFFAQVVMWGGIGISFLLFLYARRVYQKTGRVNVINDLIDYVLEEEIFEGRMDVEKEGKKGRRLTN